MKKRYGQLIIYYSNESSISYYDIVNFNLINGILYIWFINNQVIKVPFEQIVDFYYAYTPY